MGDILFLAHRIPYPPNRGDKIRAFNILKHLAARKRVHLAAFADDSRDLNQKKGLEPFTSSRSILWRGKSSMVAAVEALLSQQPVSLTAFASRPMRETIDRLLADHAIDTIYVFSGQMAQYLPARPRQRVVMDFVDVDSDKFAAYAERGWGPVKWMMAREARMLSAFERDVAAAADASLFVSEAEADLFRARSRAERIHAIENGIDTEVFDPAASFRRIDATEPLVLFTGQMDYRPNIEAVCWFAEAILPHIQLQHPQAKFAIVGRDPVDAVKALTRFPGVRVVGEVSDVRGWIAAASVCVAPLRIARGVQNKVLEAMAMARPVVASIAAAQGIDHGDTIRVGADVGGIADAVSTLLADRAAAEALGRSARAKVIERYGWAARLAPLDALMNLPPLVPSCRPVA